MTQLIWLLSFLLPFQLSLYLSAAHSLVYGFQIDYLIPAIYLTDIVFLMIFVRWVNINRKRLISFVTSKNILILSGIVTFVYLNIAISKYPVANIYKWMKVVELVFLAYLVKTDRTIKVFEHFVKPLSYSVPIVCLMAILQTVLGRSLSPLFYLLGERTFTISTPGISTFVFFGKEILRSYSTFSHPNSLAGFLLVFLFLFLRYRKKISKPLFSLTILLLFITFITSHSLNILIAVTGVFLVSTFAISKKLVIVFLLTASLLMPFIKINGLMNKSVVERDKLAKASLQIVKTSPFIGVGLNNFIPNLISTDLFFENSWQLQPVHNSFLLILSEVGVLGLFFVTSFLFSMQNIFFLLPILFTGLFDHYWLTLQQNMLLMAMIIGFSFDKLKDRQTK